MGISLSELCFDLPKEFKTYMRYCRNLHFQETPDYDYLISIFRKLARKEKMDLDDKVYDWNIKATCILEFNELCD
jgi:hypothetical protein